MSKWLEDRGDRVDVREASGLPGGSHFEYGFGGRETEM